CPLHLPRPVVGDKYELREYLVSVGAGWASPSSSPKPIKTHIACIISVSAASLRLENDNHVFKWIDEAFTDEIQQLENQVRMLKEEVQFLKATRRSESELSEGPKIMEPKIKISGGCVILAVVLVLGIKMYKK
ncbi:unnamed protein product, partial [Brassica oleracea]